MNILVINQPTNNRGDESAHRGLLMALTNRYPTLNISVAFFGENHNSVGQMQIKNNNVKYICIPYAKGVTKLAKYAVKCKMWKLLLIVHPRFRQMNKLIRSADVIINAPGGICMGTFKNWTHILWLMSAKRYNKPIAYYSRSFGPFAEITKEDRMFKSISIDLLKYFSHLSIRDERTMQLADNIGLNYIPSIDTAFICHPDASIPSDVISIIGEKYVVFVPNSLVWHTSYINADIESIDKFYLLVIDMLSKHYNSDKIVMMPQLFNDIRRNDYDYFLKLKSLSSHKNNIIVLPDTIGSDIQQKIIAGSGLVIGARYHSIVFAINNRIPFISLSYEHKMFGLLSIAKYDHRQIDIRKIGTDEFDASGALNSINSILSDNISIDCSEANAIAQNCFDILCDGFINNYLSK